MVGAIAGLLGALAAPAAAELRFADGRPEQQAFRDAVSHCFELFSAAPDAETREILEVLQRPAGMGRRHYDPEGVHRGQLYGVGAPGAYTMHVIYRFADPWTQPADVFTGETNVAKVTFVVGP